MVPNDQALATYPRSFKTLFAQAGVRQVGGRPIPDMPIAGLADDSRAVRERGCFVAVKGGRANGHAFVEQAVRAGAVVVVVEAGEQASVSEPAVVVKVRDTREALARLAAVYYGVQRGGPNELRLIGITGTNGKSTVAWLIRAILQAAGESCALMGTIEYDIAGQREPSRLTTPGPLALCEKLATARRAGTRFGVLEVSSHALDQRRCDGLTFDAAVFTNLSGDHLDYHETMDAYFEAKRRLFDLCDKRSTAFVNVDDAYGRRLIDSLEGPSVSFSLDAPRAAIRADVCEVSQTGTAVRLHLGSGILELIFPLVGRHNISNALAAATTCVALGIDLDSIRRGLESVKGVPGRLQRVEPSDCPFSVFVDYAHTDAALANVLSAVRPITSGRVICVFGCGGDRDRTKRPRMAAVVGRGADVAFVTSDNPRSEDPVSIIQDILGGFEGAMRCAVRSEPDRRAAIRAAMAEAKPGDTVLIAGKGHEDYQIIGAETLPFDDVDVARDALKSSMNREVPA